MSNAGTSNSGGANMLTWILKHYNKIMEGQSTRLQHFAIASLGT